MSFRFKTIIGIAVIEAVTLSLLIWTSLTFLKNSNEKALMERASTTAVMFATMTTDAVLSFDLASLESFIAELLKNPGVVYGRIVSSSDGLLAEGGDRRILAKPFAADTDFRSVRDSVYDVESKIRVEGVDYGAVQLGLSVTALQELFGSARNRITLLALAEMVLTAFFSLILGLWLTRQLGSLAEGSRQISAGNLGYQIPIRGRDELAQTADTFNRMSLDLEQSYRQLNDALTEARRTGAELALSEAKMRAVLDGAVDGIITIDEKGVMESFNPAAERIFGYSSAEIIGQNVRLIVPEPHKKRHDRYIQNYLQSGIPRVIGIGRETEGERRNGETFPIELGVSEINVNEKRLFIGIVRDITERKQTEEELRQHRENLEQLVDERTRELKDTQQQLVEQAFESGRAQLAAMMLHNIGNAVTPFTAQVDALAASLPEHVVTYLEKSYADLNDHRDGLGIYVRENPRGQQVFAYLGELIDSLKDFQANLHRNVAKMQTSLDYVGDILSLQQAYAPGEKEIRQMTDLNHLIDSALQMQAGALEKRNIAVTRDLEPNLHELVIDRNRMVQVLVNLIKNAYEAIAAGPQAGDGGQISVTSHSDSDRIIIEITDSGIGIDPGRAEEVLERGKSGKGSTGLGLYYCRMFMQNNNGKLVLESPGIGQGMTVKLIFNRQ
ncbi:MAG: PAS domain S-box protein [Deltaproteobacteria bacterium]|jgi:PAS domain S-box-containing protein|nr:PAS domain S-box protein [Deltaproteobacteria bacterium]